MVFLAGAEDRDIGIGYKIAFAALTAVFLAITLVNVFTLWVILEAM